MASFAVMLTVWNRPEYLEQAIQSVRAQTFGDFELLILDDNSDHPDVDEIITRHAREDGRISAYTFATTLEDRKASVRYATLINWGEEHSDSKWIAYLPDDDWWSYDWLERAAAKLDQGHQVVYGSQRCINEDGEAFFYRDASEVITATPYGRVDHSQVAQTRESFDLAGGWPTDPRFWRYADGEFWNRLTDKGYAFFPIDHPHLPMGSKRYIEDSVDIKCRAGRDPWA